jgi:hypothetical protein
LFTFKDQEDYASSFSLL